MNTNTKRLIIRTKVSRKLNLHYQQVNNILPHGLKRE